MPMDRDQLIRQGRRNYEVLLGRFLETEPDVGQTESATLFEPEADGLAAYLLSGAPGATVDGLAMPPTSAGQYYCLVGGSVHTNEDEYFPRALLWAGNSAEVPHLVAGPDGCHILVLQFPSPTAPVAAADVIPEHAAQ
jgi:hypothetical protein